MQKIIYDTYGNADVLRKVESEKPSLPDNHVLVKVMAGGVNPLDFKLRSGALKWVVPSHFPRVPGAEVAGVVEESNSPFFKAGNKVFAMLSSQGGGYSEYLSIKEQLVCPMPKNVSFEEAAVIPLAALTALQALRDKGRADRDKTVLINGASGGVGMYAVQVAKVYGATVTGVCSGKNVDFVKSLGADKVIDYQQQDFTRSDKQYDIVFDAVGKSTYFRCRPIITSKGVYVSTLPSFGLMLKQLINVFSSRKGYLIICKPGRDDLEVLRKITEEGNLKTHIDHIYNLEEAADAHRHIEKGRVRGKLVIKMNH